MNDENKQKIQTKNHDYKRKIERKLRETNEYKRIEKKVKEAAKEKLKREIQQAKQLQRYLKEIDEISPLGEKETVKLWDKVWIKMKERKENEILKLEREIFKGNLKLMISPARRQLDTPYVKPYFTFLEVIKEGEKDLWEAIRKWPRERKKLTFHNFSIFMHYCVGRRIHNASNLKRYKVVTGEDYRGNPFLLDVISYPPGNGNVLLNPMLKLAERKVTEELLKKKKN